MSVVTVNHCENLKTNPWITLGHVFKNACSLRAITSNQDTQAFVRTLNTKLIYRHVAMHRFGREIATTGLEEGECYWRIGR